LRCEIEIDDDSKFLVDKKIDQENSETPGLNKRNKEENEKTFFKSKNWKI